MVNTKQHDDVESNQLTVHYSDGDTDVYDLEAWRFKSEKKGVQLTAKDGPEGSSAVAHLIPWSAIKLIQYPATRGDWYFPT